MKMPKCGLKPFGVVNIPKVVIASQPGSKYLLLFRSYDKTETTLPRKVVEWLDLQTTSGVLAEPYQGPTGAMSDLTSLNDNGCSFAEITDLIESKPKGLFVEEP